MLFLIRHRTQLIADQFELPVGGSKTVITQAFDSVFSGSDPDSFHTCLRMVTCMISCQCSGRPRHYLIKSTIRRPTRAPTLAAPSTLDSLFTHVFHHFRHQNSRSAR